MISAASIAHSTRSTGLILARMLQVAMICLTMGLFSAGLPLNYGLRSVVCEAEPCPPFNFVFRSENDLAKLGLTVDSFAKFTVGLDILLAMVFTACALVIFIRKPRDPFMVFVTVMLVTFGMATFGGGIRVIAYTYPKLNLLVKSIEMFGNVAMLAFYFVFPNGRFTPRWTVAIVILWFLLVFPPYFLPDSPLNLQSKGLVFDLIFYATLLSGIASQIFRYIRVSDPIEKQQTKWVVYGLTIGMGGYVAVSTIGTFVPDLYGSALPIGITLLIVGNLFIQLLPLSISIAVIRYRLWDIDPIVNRTLVYATLTALVIGIYVLVVSYLSFVFHTQANFLISLIATGIIAVSFQPLRERLQQSVNRLMYGERDEPAVVLSRLGQRLEASLEPDSVLPSVVETVGQALKLPYVAIALKDATDFAIAAEYGRFATDGESEAELVKMPLMYQSETVGELLVSPRASNERFSPADKKLLSMLSQQAGVAAHAIRLTHELRSLNVALQKSREQLVSAREEERRRIRRDLHDGVGPILASLLQRLDAVRLLIPRDPEKAADMAEALKGQVKTTIADIRRLVYALRPPVLDELGLLSAIREYTSDYEGAGNLQITLRAPETLPQLPAAVEVAAYRIVLEAFANVVHHAQATTCDITIRIEERKTGSMFCVDVKDNGKGMHQNHRAGVGMVSIRERTSELGGSIAIESSAASGTLVRACLPFSKEEK